MASGSSLIFGEIKAFLVTLPSIFVVPSDLTAEERQELENIRRRKQELLADIQVGEWHGGFTSVRTAVTVPFV